MRFTHAGLVPRVRVLRNLLERVGGFYIGGSLRSLITTGEGKPSRNPNEVRYREVRASP